MSTWQDEHGRWHAEACVKRRRLHRRLPQGASEGDAKLLESELTVALHASTAARPPSVPGNPLLNDVLGDYYERHAATLRSPETARFHALRIGRWLEGKRASDTRAVVKKIKTDLLPVYAPATINRSLGCLSKALADAWERGDITQDYSSLVKRLPENNVRTTTLTLAEAKAISDCASEQVRIALWLSLYTGCRRGEVLAMRPHHIIGADLVIPAGNTKTMRTRSIPIVAAARPWLAQLPLEIAMEGLKTGFRRAADKAGMPMIHFHDLRRSCGTLMIQAGVELHVVGKILGHTSTQVTEARYAHLANKQMAAGLDRAFGGR
jgi:integrase